MNKRKPIATCVLAMLLTAGIFGNTLAAAAWNVQGPGPTINGQDEGITSPQGDNPVSGAVQAVAPLVTTPNYSGDANVLYVAGANGGVWKTTNAIAASPTWTPLTDQALPGTSIQSLAISPLNANVIFAGSGRTSAFAGDGTPTFGIGKSTDGGATWTVVGANLAGQDVRSIVPTQTLVGGGQVVLAGTSAGVYRSTDDGTTYTQVTTGIPPTSITDLVGDPGVSTRFYAATGGNVYISNNTGATWALVTGTGTGFTVIGGARVLLSVHHDVANDVVYAMVISGGTLNNVYRSANQGVNWTTLGVPSPPIFPGGQGGIHGAIVADKTGANTVYIAGDRQDCVDPNCSPLSFPNINGAFTFSANVFRNVSGVWQNMVMNGNNGGANGTSPHADARAMVFDENGDIVHGNDGGIVKLVSPNGTTNVGNTGTRVWVSLNSNITPTEAHSAAYDPLSKVFIAGTQDTGTTYQVAGALWNDALQGDGDTVAVDADQAAHAGTSIRYVGFTGLPAYRFVYGALNNFVNSTPLVFSLGGGNTIDNTDPNIQFYTPYKLNRINPRRMLLGTANIYESLDQGNTATNLGFTNAFIGDGFGNSPISYGGYNANGTPNPGVFFVAAGTRLYHRTADGQPVTFTTPGGTIRAVVMDPRNVTHVFYLTTSNQVFGSFDDGATWTNLTGNLGSLTTSGRTIEIFSPDATPKNTVLIVGGAGGVWQLRRPGAAGTTWTALSAGLPKALVYDLQYDYTDNVLTAGTLGRGVWSLVNFFRGGGGTGLPVVAIPPTWQSQSSGSAVAPFGPISPINLPPEVTQLAPVAAPRLRTTVIPH